MFDHTFVDGIGKTNKSWTVALSFALEFLAVGVLILIRLLWAEVLPKTARFSMLTAPAPPPRPVPPPPPQPAHKAAKLVRRRIFGHVLHAPAEIPAHVSIFTAEQQPLSSASVISVLDGGVDLSGIGTAGPIIGPAPQPPPASPPIRMKESPKKLDEPYRQSSGVQAARCDNCPKPAYPPIARQARIQGVVVLSAIIAKDGTVKQLTLVSSANPVLTGAAMASVARWVYIPTILNNEPVEVSTEITVNFTLQ